MYRNKLLRCFITSGLFRGSGKPGKLGEFHFAKFVSCLTSFFPIVDMCLSCEDIARQSYAMVPRWRFLVTFLRPAFAASRVQQVSDLHLKFALRPHHVWKYGRHPIYGR